MASVQIRDIRCVCNGTKVVKTIRYKDNKPQEPVNETCKYCTGTNSVPVFFPFREPKD